MICVTSFSRTGYDLYGHEFLRRAQQFWPGEIIVYHEEPTPPTNEFDKVQWNLLFDIPGITGFLSNIRNVPLAHGKTEAGYNYNYDAWKFSRKAFCQWDACFGLAGEKVFWIDADVQMQKPIPREFCEWLFLVEPLVYLGRPGFYTETGFVGFDMGHRDTMRFLEAYQNVYRLGTLFTLPRWHDCAAFDKALETTGIKGHDIGAEIFAKKNDIDIFDDTVLGRYMIHNKGAKKHAVAETVPAIA